MFRPSRRLFAALLWLAIALLPLRGFAALMMPATEAPPHGVATAMDAHGPCHGAADEPTPAAGTHAGCSLCDLCHSSALALDAPILQLASVAQAGPPLASAAAPEARAPDGLFRPPRALLA